MLNKNSRLLVTIVEKGAIGSPVSYKNSKDEIFKLLTSPYERQSGKGYITPHGHYCAPDRSNYRVEQQCHRKINVAEEAVKHFTSDEPPFSIKKNQWLKLTPIQKIEAHLHLLSEGKEFFYEII